MTFESRDVWVLRVAAKYARFVGEGRVTPEEYVNRLFDEFAGDPAMQTQYAADVVGLIPPDARDFFARRVSAALQPGNVRRAFALGGRSPEAEHEAALRETARERAWAEVLLPLLAPPDKIA